MIFAAEYMVHLVYICNVCYIFFTIKIENRKAGLLVAAILQIIITGLGYLSIAWHRGTIAWAYVFSFPAGVIWGKIRNKEITPEKKKVVCILSFAFSALVVAYRYGKTHEGLEELFFTLLAAVGIIAFFELINLEDFPIIGGGCIGLEKSRFYVFE